MGKRDVDDFPFAYLADNKTPVQKNRPEGGTRVRDDRPHRRSGSREIEKLLIVAIVLTIMFIILLTAAIMVGANKKKEKQAETSGTTTGQTVEGQTTSAIGQSDPIDSTTQIAVVTDPTQLAVVQIG
ncbi:MAG: hypothetical protein PHP22_09540 [Oscillospiraceae bacterium]|nr:hypothetical protein [Oscillospiraceae bacterium]